MSALVFLSAILATALVKADAAIARAQPIRGIITRQSLPVAPRRAPVLERLSPGKQYAILRSESVISPDGSHYQYLYETENGISAHEQGDLVGSGKDAGISATGGFQYTSPEGVPVQIDYQADENGFQPSGNVLPTPPPIPAVILRALEYIEKHPPSQQEAGLLTRRQY